MRRPSVRERDKACASAESEFYEIAARLLASGVGLYLIAGVMHRAWERLEREALPEDTRKPEPLDIW